MIFIYPSKIALAAMTLSTWIRWVMYHRGRAWVSWLTGLLVLAGLIHPLSHVIRNHPNTYIYFNEWAGGVNRAYGTYETDYYANSLRPATDYFLEEILPGLDLTEGVPLKVASNSNISYYLRNHRDQVRPFYSRYYDRGKHDWDYAILYCNYIHPYQLQNGLWPPKNTIHEVRVDSVVVAAIVERKSRADHYGSVLLKEGMNERNDQKLTQAQAHLENALDYDPNNEIAHLDLANCYTAHLEFTKARALMDHLLEIYPDYDKALNIKGYTYLVETEYTRNPELLDQAISWINKAIKSNYKFYSGYYNLGLCYGLLNDLDNAEYNFRQAIRYNSKFTMAYEKLADVYEMKGDLETAGMVREKAATLR
jgi:Tfp pilus assembly protein PilF